MLVTTSDVDSSGDATVTAQSVEGEDDLVDVSMQDTIEGDAVSHQEAERYAVIAITTQYSGANQDKDYVEFSRNSTLGAQTGPSLTCIWTDSSRICST